MDDKKDNVGGDASGEDKISIVVKEQDDNTIQFKVKKTTKMEKIFNAFAKQKGVQVSSLRFLLDGENILAQSTPKMLELEDGDQIDVMLEQIGGKR